MASLLCDVPSGITDVHGVFISLLVSVGGRRGTTVVGREDT